MPLLSVNNIQVFYGKSQALFDFSLKINPVEVVELIGINGCRKYTKLLAICGIPPARTGSIQRVYIYIKQMPSHKVAQLGIGLVPEGRRCFPNLNVYENLVATARTGNWSLKNVYQLFPRLAERNEQYAATLSGGEQQMLAISRALLTNPKLLILDEATEGLAPVVRHEIWAAIHTLRDAGQSLLIVDKTLKELLPVCNHCFILEKGRSVWDGTPLELTDDISTRYLGVHSA